MSGLDLQLIALIAKPQIKSVLLIAGDERNEFGATNEFADRPWLLLLLLLCSGLLRLLGFFVCLFARLGPLAPHPLHPQDKETCVASMVQIVRYQPQTTHLMNLQCLLSDSVKRNE